MFRFNLCFFRFFLFFFPPLVFLQMRRSRSATRSSKTTKSRSKSSTSSGKSKKAKTDSSPGRRSSSSKPSLKKKPCSHAASGVKCATSECSCKKAGRKCTSKCDCSADCCQNRPTPTVTPRPAPAPAPAPSPAPSPRLEPGGDSNIRFVVHDAFVPKKPVTVAKLRKGASVLGKGGEGTVYGCVLNKADIAVKVLQTDAKEHGDLNVLDEAVFLMKLNDTNVVRIIGFSESPPAVLMERADYKSLSDVMNLAKTPMGGGGIAEPLAFDMIHQIGLGLSYLHFKDVTHRDLKPANVLVFQGLTLKISDFGLAREHVSTYKSRVAGTYPYMAPECFSEEVSKKADVYAFGITCWELLTLDRFLRSVPSAQILHKVYIEGVRPNAAQIQNAVLRKLLVRCWDKDKASRPLMTEVTSMVKRLKEENPVERGEKERLENVLILAKKAATKI